MDRIGKQHLAHALETLYLILAGTTAQDHVITVSRVDLLSILGRVEAANLSLPHSTTEREYGGV